MQHAVSVQTAATERGDMRERVTPPIRCASPRRGIARHAARAVADQQVGAHGRYSAEQGRPVRAAWRPDAEHSAWLVSRQRHFDRALFDIGGQRIGPPRAVVRRSDRHADRAEGAGEITLPRADFQPRPRQSQEDTREGGDKLNGGQMEKPTCPANGDESGAGSGIGQASIEGGVGRQRVIGEPRLPVAPGGIVGDARRGERFAEQRVEVIQCFMARSTSGKSASFLRRYRD